MTRLGATVALKTVIVGAVLAGLVAAGYYGLNLVADGRREGLSTLAGAAATIFAGWLAWQSVIFQARRAEIEKIERAKARKANAVIALTQAVHATSTMAAIASAEIDRVGDSDGKSLRVKKIARMVDQVVDKDLITVLLDDLSADDRLNLLMIVGQMRTALAMAEIQSQDRLSVDNFKVIRTVLTELEGYLAAFDKELHAAFVTVARTKVWGHRWQSGGNFCGSCLEVPGMPG